MENLNNPKSEIYKKTLEVQKIFIQKRLDGIRTNRYLNDEMGCIGEKETIANHLNHGPAANIVHGFFNKMAKKCVICGRSRGIKDGDVRQLERAHCNIYSRYDLLMMAINDLYIDNNTPIKVGDILKLFIQKHEKCPLYMLCSSCHNKYDN